MVGGCARRSLGRRRDHRDRSKTSTTCARSHLLQTFKARRRHSRAIIMLHEGRRDIASIPSLPSGETWQAILDHHPHRLGRRESLEGPASVMESLIADEHPATVPIVVKGNGASPRHLLPLQ